MNQPTEPLPQYPAGARMPQPGKPPVPAPVANAIKTMYVGAAATVIGIIIEILTVGDTKRAIQKHSPHLTASQLSATEHTLIVGFIISGVIATGAWIVIARMCRNGSNGARVTGTVLFALATVDTIISAAAPQAAAIKIWWPVIWLAGLVAVIFLWQPASTAFFKRTGPR